MSNKEKTPRWECIKRISKASLTYNPYNEAHYKEIKAIYQDYGDLFLGSDTPLDSELWDSYILLIPTLEKDILKERDFWIKFVNSSKDLEFDFPGTIAHMRSYVKLINLANILGMGGAYD